MKKEIVSQKSLSNLSILSKKEQAQVKGGLLLYCEEKRRTNIFGQSYTSTQWKIKSDGSLWLNIKM